MKSVRRYAVTLIVVAVMAFSGGAFAADKKEMALELGYFKPSLEFNAHYVVNGLGTGDVSFKDDLGLCNKNAPEYRLWLNDSLRLSYAHWDFFGSSSLSRNITYGGITYPAGSRASGDLDVHYYRLTWMRPITKSPAVKTDWLIDVKVFNFKASIIGQDSLSGATVTRSKNFRGAIPTIGFRVVTNPEAQKGVSLFGEISGLPLGKYGYFYDAEAGIEYHVNAQFSVKAAYRTFDLNAKDGKAGGDKAQFKQSGPYFEVNYKF